jgi:uncharacterized protein
MDVSLVLTHDCNLGCGYCYTGAKFRKRMPREIARKGLDMAFAPNRLGEAPRELQLSYFGGEPVLEFELLIDVARDARERAKAAGVKLVQTVTTNGTLLDEAKIRALYELDVYVALSIDGVREAHDRNRPRMGGGSSFDAVERGLELLVAAGRSFETITVVTPATAARAWRGSSPRGSRASRSTPVTRRRGTTTRSPAGSAGCAAPPTRWPRACVPAAR